MEKGNKKAKEHKVQLQQPEQPTQEDQSQQPEQPTQEDQSHHPDYLSECFKTNDAD